jgi:hypothetical protein
MIEQHGRRSLLKMFASLPAISWLSSLDLLAKANQAVLPSASPNDLQVQILRHINTAQSWYKADNGRFTDLARLNASATMQRVLSDPRVVDVGLGKQLHEQLRFEGPEITAGWRLNFAVSDDGSRYAASLLPTEPIGHLSLATDERGVIYKGTKLTSGPLTAAMRADEVVQQRLPNRAISFVRGIAFALASCSYCDPGCLCLSCCCTTQYCGDCGCTNCGCSSCVWCVTCGCA